MKFFVVAALAAVIAPVWALEGMASTTRYYDGFEGACGCGNESGNFPWQLGITPQIYTAAGSPSLYSPTSPSTTFCGSGCGTCYLLTSSGESACPDSEEQSCGTGGVPGESITVMLTNLCPHQGNEEWCPEIPGDQNEHGFEYHFDIMAREEVFGDNPVVAFVEVPCPYIARSRYQQCVCARQ